MSLKMKLTSTICAFLLILGLVITGVFAVPQATVNLGGTLTFKASDVYARVTGTITGSKEDPTLTPIEFNAGTATGTSSWTNDLAFKDDASTMTISINVENLATDRPLYVSIIDSFGYVVNIEKTLLNGAFKLSSGANATATITLGIENPNKSLSNAGYGYTIELLDESVIPSYDEISGLSISCDVDKQTATITGNTLSEETDVVIPAYVKSGDVVCAITSIGDGAFVQSSYVKSVLIPNTVTSLGMDVFVECRNLGNSLILPDSITSIGMGCFVGCSNLEYVQLPYNNMGYLAQTFDGCSLKHINLRNITSLTADPSFGVESMVIPDTIKSLGVWALKGVNNIYYKGSEEQWNAIEGLSDANIPEDAIITFAK